MFDCAINAQITTADPDMKSPEHKQSFEAEDQQDDISPGLTNMPSVIWENSLSFLPPAGISAMSNRICKTLGVGEDKAASAEKAAQLALENLMIQACKAMHPNDYTKYSTENLITHFDGESYLRTYQLASVMERVATLKRDELFEELSQLPSQEEIDELNQKNEEAQAAAALAVSNAGLIAASMSELSQTISHAMTEADNARSKLRDALNRSSTDDKVDVIDFKFPAVATMWLLYGRPALPPLTERRAEIANFLVGAFNYYLVMDEKMKTEEEFERRSRVQAKLDLYCRTRILCILSHSRAFGASEHINTLASLLQFGRARTQRHIVQADYDLGSNVVLHGLKKTELNGSTGIVKTEFNPSVGRIGVGIDGKGGKERMISIKPVNLRCLDEETDFTIDMKILQGQILSGTMEIQTNFNPPWLPVVIYMLRSILPTLRADVEALAENDVGAIENPLFSNRQHRLFHGEIALASLVTRAAKYVGFGFLSPSFGGLVCCPEYPNFEAQVASRDSAEQMKKVYACKIFLEEAKVSLYNTGSLVLGDSLAHERDLALADLRNTAAVISSFTGLPQVSVPHHAESLQNNPKIVISILRTNFEGLLEKFASSNDGQLSVNTIATASLPRGYCINLFRFAKRIGEVYGQADMVMPGVFADTNEDDNHDAFLLFALVVSSKILGLGHKMTESIKFLMSALSMAGGPSMNLDNVDTELEVSVNEWLLNFVPLYYGTSRAHVSNFE